MRSDLLAVDAKAEPALPLAWWRYSSIAIAALIVGVMIAPLWWSAGKDTPETSLAPACAQWDDLARESIARQVQNGKRDADLRLVGDAIFRLRRARRNCDAGWTTLACRDYVAVTRGTSAAVVSPPPDQPECTLTSFEAAGVVH